MGRNKFPTIETKEYYMGLNYNIKNDKYVSLICSIIKFVAKSAMPKTCKLIDIVSSSSSVPQKLNKVFENAQV